MQQEFIGKHSIENLQDLLKDVKKALVFTDKFLFAKIKDKISCEFDVYDNFEVNPKEDQVKQAMSSHNINNYQAIIAFGGGSVIDFAKLYKHYNQSSIKLIAIPTTAGTGSEATQFAVVYINGEKHSLDNSTILPNYAIVDSHFLQGSPKYLKASSAIDAYCQAIESYWSVQSTTESKAYAKEAIILAKENIINFVNSDNEICADSMAKASHLAGKAINISRTTAAHALSYKITSDYGIPHGHAVALSMADLFEANLNVDENTYQDNRGLDYVKTTMAEILAMIGVDDFKQYWQGLAETIGLELSFEKLNIVNKQSIIKSVNQQRLKNNPKDITIDVNKFWIY